MAVVEVKIKIGFAWWLRPWLFGLEIACRLTGGEPDWQKVDRMVNRALRLRVV